VTVKEKLEQQPIYDVAVLRHGFAEYMRDYHVLIEAMWGTKEWGDEKGTYLLRFSHCPLARLETRLSDETWRASWDERFTDYERWSAGGEPEGFVWGARWSDAYPGVTYVDSSALAAEWTARFQQPMHEVTLETNVFTLTLVFHDFSITKVGDDVSVIDNVLIPLK
jgi:hypothetical protein